jgi:hypothetical protein
MAHTPVSDVPFELALEVTSIRYRLHPLDVGFDLRESSARIVIGREPRLRVSYPARDGSRRVLEGPREAVLRRLRRLGFRFRTEEVL